MSRTLEHGNPRRKCPCVYSCAAIGSSKPLVGGYTSWRLHKAAIAQLRSMSDRQLADIGVSRSEIEHAVRGKRDRAVSHRF